MYIEDWKKLFINNKIQLLCTKFLEKYSSLDLYDECLEKIFIIHHKTLKFDKNYGWTLIGIPGKPDVYLVYHEYFFIRDDLFDRIKSTHQDKKYHAEVYI